MTAWEPSSNPICSTWITGGRGVCNFDEGLVRLGPTTEVISPLAKDVWTFALDLASSSVTGPRDIGDGSRRDKIGVTGPGRKVARISGIAVSGETGNYQGCTIV